MIGGIRLEVWLAAGYALFLLVAAFVLERLARHCQSRGQLIHTAGFKYRHEIDHLPRSRTRLQHLRSENCLYRFRSRA